jgi:hypothetical protein
MTRKNTMGVSIQWSDLHPKSGKESAPKKASRQILIHELIEGVRALERGSVGLFISGLSAGNGHRRTNPHGIRGIQQPAPHKGAVAPPDPAFLHAVAICYSIHC